MARLAEIALDPRVDDLSIIAGDVQAVFLRADSPEAAAAAASRAGGRSALRAALELKMALLSKP